MKRIFFVFILLVLVPFFARAEDVVTTLKNLRIVISEVSLHKDYEELFNGLKRIVGVSNLFTTSESKDRIIVTGRFIGEVNVLVNDVAALVMDRYKFDKKERKEVIEISLKKL